MRALAACGSIALLLAACGARTELDEGVAAAGDAAAGHAIDAAVDAAHEATDASAPHADAARDAGTDAAGEDASTARQFQGVVLALWTPAGATPFQAYADFTTAQQPFGITCPSSPQNIGACCCRSGIDLPDPSPSAGTLQLSRLTGMGVLVLLPATSGYQGTSDLGPGWYALPGLYDYTASGEWFAGDAIAVAGGGSDVLGFEGTLHTGAALAGVAPPIGPDAVVIDRSQAFEVSWTPEGLANEQVLLTLRQITSDSVDACFCSAPDSAGELTVDPTVLAPFQTVQLGSTIRLERAITSTILSDDAVIDLVGEVAQEADLSFQ